MGSRAKVRLLFEVNRKAIRYQEVYQYTMNNLLTDIGSWMGYIAIALSVLSYWQWLRKPFGIGNATAVGAATGRASAEADEEELTEILKKVERLRKRYKPDKVEKIDSRRKTLVDKMGGSSANLEDI